MEIEAIAAICGILGSYMLASKQPWARYGWCVYLVSNIAWIGFALYESHYWLLVQSLAFLGSSLLGLWNNFDVMNKFKEDKRGSRV